MKTLVRVTEQCCRCDKTEFHCPHTTQWWSKSNIVEQNLQNFTIFVPLCYFCPWQPILRTLAISTQNCARAEWRNSDIIMYVCLFAGYGVDKHSLSARYWPWYWSWGFWWFVQWYSSHCCEGQWMCSAKAGMIFTVFFTYWYLCHLPGSNWISETHMLPDLPQSTYYMIHWASAMCTECSVDTLIDLPQSTL